jgi:ribose transport system permease protein
MSDLFLRLRHGYGVLFAVLIYVVLVYVITTAANTGTALAFVAMGQTLAVLTGGLDLSIGSILALTNSLASVVVNGSPVQVALGVCLVLLAGLGCGLVNGAIVVYGRIQPIIATLAMGAIYTGLALLLRPVPGGRVDEGLSEALTYETFGVIPTSLILLLAAVVFIWLPFKNSVLGRGVYAVGSAELAAYMSGVRIDRSRLAAFALAGLFASMGGLFLGFQTLSGDALIGLPYTLNSIAAVVIGGTSLYGGAGGVVGSIFGAYVLRTINGVLFFSGAPALAQPLFEGMILLGAVALSAVRIVRMRNRLEVMG